MPHTALTRHTLHSHATRCSHALLSRCLSRPSHSPPKSSGAEKVEAVVGFHVYPALQQILSVGDLEKDSAVLAEEDDFYSGCRATPSYAQSLSTPPLFSSVARSSRMRVDAGA